MRGLGWTEAELNSRLKNDSGKLAMAARVRKETTLPIKWIAARLQWAPQKASNISRFIGDTPMRMPTAAHDAHNSSSNLRFDPFCALARANPSLMQPCGRRGNWLLG